MDKFILFGLAICLSLSLRVKGAPADGLTRASLVDNRITGFEERSSCSGGNCTDIRGYEDSGLGKAGNLGIHGQDEYKVEVTRWHCWGWWCWSRYN